MYSHTNWFSTKCVKYDCSDIGFGIMLIDISVYSF